MTHQRQLMSETVGTGSLPASCNSPDEPHFAGCHSPHLLHVVRWREDLGRQERRPLRPAKGVARRKPFPSPFREREATGVGLSDFRPLDTAVLRSLETPREAGSSELEVESDPARAAVRRCDAYQRGVLREGYGLDHERSLAAERRHTRQSSLPGAANRVKFRSCQSAPNRGNPT